MKDPRSAISTLIVLLALAPWGCQRRSAPPAPTPVEVDELLVLMKQRLELMHDVARWKWNAKQPIADPERERQLLDRLADKGQVHGLEAAFTRDFFRAQIEAAKLLQQADFDDWQAKAQGPFPDVPDLGKDLRPRIDELGDKLLAALASVQRARGDPRWPTWLDERAARLLAGAGITPELRTKVLVPIKDQLTPAGPGR